MLKAAMAAVPESAGNNSALRHEALSEEMGAVDTLARPQNKTFALVTNMRVC